MTTTDRNPRVLNFALAAATFVSAWLLFQIQPMVTKRVLPWFGGGASVWTTAMLFFQATLLAGYLYAHLAVKKLSARAQVTFHTALLVAAAALAISAGVLPGDDWKPESGDHPVLRILGMMAASVGLPFVVLASTAPLVQVWYSRANFGKSPYRLYALSNIGSLAALISYPLAIEPQLGVARQGIVWSALFAGFAALLAACGWMSLKFGDELPSDGGDARVVETQPNHASTEVNPSALQRFQWWALPACASVLLLAVTTYVCQDVASIPLLWIPPLVVYLLSFILTFDSDRWYRRWFWMPVAAGASFWVAYTWHNFINVSIQWQTAAHLVLLLAACMVCHGELARLRPAPAHLTSFYLSISAGGALGGLIAGVAAPLLLPDYYELPISIIVAWFLALAALITDRRSPFYDGRRLYGLLAMVGLLIALGISMSTELRNRRQNMVASARNFYGVLRVKHHNRFQPEIEYFALLNGRIQHGIQYQHPQMKQYPAQYYVAESGIGQLLWQLRGSGPRRVGVIGLGTGTLGAFADAGDVYVFYDINPKVIQFAGEFFSYLEDARQRGAEVEIKDGDARLALERDPPRKFDVLAVDAFSGDAIPAHLLTLEAVELYLSHLQAPDGVLALHVTNQHLDLLPVVLAAAERFNLAARYIRTEGDGSVTGTSSTWILLQRREGFFKDQELGEPLVSGDRIGLTPITWTDDYSNLLDILK